MESHVLLWFPFTFGILISTVASQVCPQSIDEQCDYNITCRDDDDCDNGQMCCRNGLYGCGYECMDPVASCAMVQCAVPDCYNNLIIVPKGARECCPLCACRRPDGRLISPGEGYDVDCNVCTCEYYGVAVCTAAGCGTTKQISIATVVVIITCGTLEFLLWRESVKVYIAIAV
ncbi:uncharacterized protein [Dysidea avara]|uniref:uncharacterized protein n=1 Tax=Dysidea avara TaxID=196820 RepID=UPI003325C6A8